MKLCDTLIAKKEKKSCDTTQNSERDSRSKKQILKENTNGAEEREFLAHLARFELK